MIEFKTDADGVSFAVRVSPRASKSKVLGIHDNALKLSLAAPPVDGEANAELCEFLAKLLGVPKRAVQIVQGERGRSKVVHIGGVTADHVSAAVDAASGGR